MKTALRAQALARRDALAAPERAAAAEILAQRIADLTPNFPPGPVAGYWPIRSEADPRPAMSRLRTLGFPIALPVVTPEGLIFRLWTEAAPLRSAPFGLMEPDDRMLRVEPRTLIVPLAAFDRRGHRIGYGKGHYDRTLAALGPVLTIGLAFSIQEIAEIPAEPHDRPLDFVVTERETMACGEIRGLSRG